MKRLSFIAAFLVCSCRDTALPVVAPPPAPGTIQGTLVYAVPGKTTLTAAANARITLMGSGLATTADGEGRFLLEGVTRSSGILLLELTVGEVLRQRLFRLEDLGTGVGRDIALGQVVLARNALVRGQIMLSDVPGLTGLGGVTVYVPGGPWSVLTGDDGSYSLDALPEGSLQVAFFNKGYAVGSLDVELGAGEERTLPIVRLDRATDGAASVKATLVKGDGSAASDATVRMRRLTTEETISVSAAGTISKGELSSGVYSFAIERTGSLSIGLYNVLLLPGENDLGTLQLLDGPSTKLNLEEVVPEMPMFDAGVVTIDAGVVADSGVEIDAGTVVDAGTLGPAPVAVASGPELAPAASQVTLSGMSSTGTFPLVYRWQQTAGTQVTLSANDTALAHSPRFTAPAAGTVLEFELVVTDADARQSAPAKVRIGIGTRPVARFTPDSGSAFFGGQAIPLSSTAFDDAGVVIAAYEWKLLSGTTGTLISDGGPTAVWQTAPLAFGDPDVIGGVTLQVTNGIGVRSAIATNTYTVRGANPNNWSLDAGPTQLVAVGAVPGQVQLSGSLSSPLFANPEYSVSWSCPVSLLAGDTLTPRFVTPVIVGPTQTVTCTATVNVMPPLAPMQLTAQTNVLLRDAAAPTVVSSNVEATRMSRFGLRVTASEPLSSAAFSMSCTPTYGLGYKYIYNSAIAGSSYGVFSVGQGCTNFAVDLKDFASPQNTTLDAPFGSGTVIVSDQWHGPYVSTATFDDPRPVIATLSQMPREVQAHDGVTPGTVPGSEIVATQGSELVRLSGLDVLTKPTCEPSCNLTSTNIALGLPTNAVPTVRRAQFGGAELFVSMTTDGGVAPVVARRNAGGTWSSFAGMTGTPGNWNLELRTARFDGTSQILIDTWSPLTQSFTTTDLAATGLTEVSLLATANNLLAATVGPSKTLLIRKRNPGDLSWSTYAPTTVHTSVTSLRWEPESDGVTLLALENGAGALLIQRVDTGGLQTVSAAPVTGYDITSWGGNSYIAYSINGDIRLKTIAGSVWSGAGGGPIDFGGPPRTGYSEPYPVALDANPICEAVYPTMAFVEDALVVTWQERCSPETKWNIVARTVR